MSEVPKILGQSAPAEDVLSALYVVPNNRRAVVSAIYVCNRGNAATVYRLSIAENAAADTPSQYLFYDVPIPANDTAQYPRAGITLGPGDVVRVLANVATLTFSLFGIELEP